MVHETLPKKKIGKIIPSIKSPRIWYMVVVFFLNIYILLCIYCSNCQKTHFLNEISFKEFKSLNAPRFNWGISISYTIKRHKHGKVC